MQRLFYIKFHDEKGRFIARRDYSGLQFSNKKFTEKFINSEKCLLETALGVKLKTMPHKKEIPDFTIKQLINAYCHAMDVKYIDVVGKTRKREIVNVRLFITKTALDLGFVHGQLRPFFVDGVTYHYESKMNELMEANDIVAEIWPKIETKAMSVLVELKEDNGSGEPLKSTS